MTDYSDEPKTVAELLARYRDVKRRLYPVPSRSRTCKVTATDVENVLAFAVAVAAERASETRKRADDVPEWLPLPPAAPPRVRRRLPRALLQRNRFAVGGAGQG